MNWRVVDASVAGTSHAANSTPCQDAHGAKVIREVAGNEWLVLTVADGAGSAAHGGDGAALACEQAMIEIASILETDGADALLADGPVASVLSAVRARIFREAESLDCDVRSYACTFLAAVVGERVASFFQCGDGAIVVSSNGNQGVVFWPSEGEYANMTHFLTDDAWLQNVQICHATAAFNEIAMFSDGLQRLALSFESQVPFRPFFTPMFERLRSCSDAEYASLGDKLRTFLQSSAVNERTDDDKTLVLAAR